MTSRSVKQGRSIFDPDGQHENPDDKIVVAIERLGQTLRVLLWDSAKRAREYALSPIQIQSLIFLLFHDDRLARVGELAREFMLAPATISDVVGTLEQKGLLEKERSQFDRRAVVLLLTDEGREVARDLAGWATPFSRALRDAPDAEKVIVLKTLLSLIARLQEEGVVQTTRMCLTCRYFGEDFYPAAEAPHHCHLLDKPLAPGSLRIDCPEHEGAS